MKGWLTIILVALVVVWAAFIGAGQAQFSPSYTFQSTTVGAITPVAIMLPGTKPEAFYAAPRVSVTPVLCWPYTGATPAATPAGGAMNEVSNTQPLQGNFRLTAGGNNSVLQGFACVSEGTSSVVDSRWR